MIGLAWFVLAVLSIVGGLVAGSRELLPPADESSEP